jgi:5-hydroxyisourate hydrolase
LKFSFFYSQTNSDGRCPTLLPPGKAEKGIYRVTFETQAYFAHIGQKCFYPYVQVMGEKKNSIGK